jgi:hypothetical protein
MWGGRKGGCVRPTGDIVDELWSIKWGKGYNDEYPWLGG